MKLISFLALLLVSTGAFSAYKYDGDTEIVRWKDGDTAVVKVEVVTGVEATINARLLVDTPELKPKYKFAPKGPLRACQKALAKKALAFSKKFTSKGKILVDCGYGKGGFGRELCDIEVNGKSLSQALLTAKLAREYDPQIVAGEGWCK